MPSDRIEMMIHAARTAGERLVTDFAAMASLEVKLKNGPGDPFTEADLRAEATVLGLLRAAEPEFGFLGEEGGLIAGALSRLFPGRKASRGDSAGNFRRKLDKFAVLSNLPGEERIKYLASLATHAECASLLSQGVAKRKQVG